MTGVAWVYAGDRDVWDLVELPDGPVVGGVEGATVREWPAERLAAWLKARSLPPLPQE